MATARKPAQRTAATTEASEGFTPEERAAMQARARELKGAARRSPSTARADDERDLLAKITEMPAADRAIAERIHAIVAAAAPDLAPRTWYGMPAYARDGKVLCFFQSGEKFKSRYCTFGFSDEAKLDDGAMWPTSFALTALTADDEARITALVQKAMG